MLSSIAASYEPWLVRTVLFASGAISVMLFGRGTGGVLVNRRLRLRMESLRGCAHFPSRIRRALEEWPLSYHSTSECSQAAIAGLAYREEPSVWCKMGFC